MTAVNVGAAGVIHEDRTQFLGASDIGALLGVDPYRTPLQLYEEKVGLSTPFAGNAHTRRGTRLEEVAAEEFEQRQGVKLARINRRVSHPVYPFLTCRIDRRVVGAREMVEIKVPSLGSFHKIKRTGLHEGYIAQLQTCLGLLQYDVGHWGIFNADLWDLIPFPVEADVRLYNEIVDRAVGFWNDHIVPRVPPSATEPDAVRLEIARAEGQVPLVDMAENAAFVEAASLLREAKQLAAEATLLEEQAKARVSEVIGSAVGVYTAPGLRLSQTVSKGRASFDKKALAGTKPLDRLATSAAVLRLCGGVAADAVAALEGCDLDLSKFESAGKPYSVLRLTAGTGGNG